MRALTGSDVLVADKLFATLDTTVRALQPETEPRILVSDTVGFIKKLPHDLVASFRSTLDEAREADAAAPRRRRRPIPPSRRSSRSRATCSREIGADDAPRLLVLNKIDKVDAATRERLAAEWPDAVQLSAKDPADVAGCASASSRSSSATWSRTSSSCRTRSSAWSAKRTRRCRVLAESHDEHGTRLRVRARPEVIARLRATL